MKKVLVLGISGQLGHRIFLELRKKHTTYGTLRRTPKAFRLFSKVDEHLFQGIDAHDFASIEQIVDAINPDVVVNCVGIISQNVTTTENMMETNGHFATRLARLCEARNKYLIHFSTDCVFSGSKGSYVESDVPDPVGDYGKSKLSGEVTGSPNVLTLRTSFIGRELSNHQSLADWFFSHKKGDTIKGFTNVIFSGLPALRLSQLVSHVIGAEKRLSGLYHVSADPISKYDLLCLINEKSNRGVQIVPQDVPVLDRSLSSSRLRESLGYEIPPWTALIEDLFVDFEKYESIPTLVDVGSLR